MIEGLNHQLARSARAVSEDRRARERAEEEGAMMHNLQLPQAPRGDPPHDPLYPPTVQSLSLSLSFLFLSICLLLLLLQADMSSDKGNIQTLLMSVGAVKLLQ